MSDPTLSSPSLESSSPALDSVHETQPVYGGPAQSQGTHEASRSARQGQANDVAAANAGLTQASSGIGMNPQVNASKTAAGDVRSASGMDLPPPQPLGSFDPELLALIQRLAGADLSGITVSYQPELEQQGKLGVAQAGKTIGLSPKIKGNHRKTLTHEAVHILQHPSSGVPKAKPAPGQVIPDVEQEAISGAQALLAGEPLSIMQTVGDENRYDDNQSAASVVSAAQTDSAVHGAASGSSVADSSIAAAKLVKEIELKSGHEEVIDLVRSAAKNIREDKLVSEAIKIKSSAWGPKEKELVHLILEHGPEPLWTKDVLDANLGLVSPGATANLLELNEGYRDHEAVRDEQGHRVTAAEKARVEVAIFPGISSEVVVLHGGVHGTEVSAQMVTNELLATMKDTGTEKPYYTVVIIRSLFPDNEAAEKRHVDKATGLPSEEEALEACDKPDRPCIGNNRNYPGEVIEEEVTDDKGKTTKKKTDKVKKAYSLSESMAPDGYYRDANGEIILPETAALIKLTEQFKPLSIYALHGTGRDKAMISVNQMNPPDAVKDSENHMSVCQAADYVRDTVGKDAVQGNKCNDKSCMTPMCAPGWGGKGAVGISHGSYMASETSARPAMSSYTIEIDNKMKSEKNAEVKEERKAFADAIRLVLWGKKWDIFFSYSL